MHPQCSAEGNAPKLEVAVSETFAVQCSLHTWCQVRGCAIFSKQLPYKNSVADFIRLLYVAKKSDTLIISGVFQYFLTVIHVFTWIPPNEDITDIDNDKKSKYDKSILQNTKEIPVRIENSIFVYWQRIASD